PDVVAEQEGERDQDGVQPPAGRPDRGRDLQRGGGGQDRPGRLARGERVERAQQREQVVALTRVDRELQQDQPEDDREDGDRGAAPPDQRGRDRDDQRDRTRPVPADDVADRRQRRRDQGGGQRRVAQQQMPAGPGLRDRQDGRRAPGPGWLRARGGRPRGHASRRFSSSAAAAIGITV